MGVDVDLFHVSSPIAATLRPREQALIFPQLLVASQSAPTGQFVPKINP